MNAQEITAIAAKTPTSPAREIGIVTREIKELCMAAQRTGLMYAIEIGRRLMEAKSVLQHGEWGNWLKNEVEFSQATANNFMRLYEEYGSAQLTIFGAVTESQSFANLPYSKALQLLAVPADEREAFAKEVDAENISVRELQSAIRERDLAIKEKAEAEKRKEELEQACAHAEIAKHAAEEKAKDADALREQVNRLQEQVNASVEREKKAKEKLKAAISDPKIPKEKIDAIRAEVESEANNAARKKAQEEIDELSKAAEKANAEKMAAMVRANQAEERLEELQTKLKTASPEVSAFKALFDSMQQTAAKLQDMISKIREGDPDTADKLSAALHAFGQKL